MALERSRPEILSPPQHPPACCTQQTITAGPQVAAKTRQKHDYPSQAWRISYRRRTAAERLNAAIKDTAINNIDRGWIRLIGVTPLMLWLACLMTIRNQRILLAWDKQQQDNARSPPPSAAARPQTTPHQPRRTRRRTPVTSTSSPAPRHPSWSPQRQPSQTPRCRNQSPAKPAPEGVTPA